MSYNPNGPIKRKKLSAQKRKLFLKSALNPKVKPITLEGLEALKVGGFLSVEVFNSNVSRIFPLILERLSMGESIKKIEGFLGMKPNSLVKIIQRHTRLKEACNQARLIKNDRVVIESAI